MSLAANKELQILLLEDAARDAELIERQLRKGGLRFRFKRIDAEPQFLHELEHDPPDVILSDHGLPAFDGFTALAIARHRCPHVPFIFVTGAQGDEVAVEALKRGADDYVLKSRLDLLASAIQQALTQARQHEELRQREADHRELVELSYTLALSLGTPLAHAECFVERLDKRVGEKLDHKSRDSLKIITESVGQMSQLVDVMVKFCRIERAEMYRLHFSLGDLMKEVVRDLRRETQGREVQWVLGELPEVVGDPALLLWALTDLADNALKFTRSRCPARIEIGSNVTELEIVVSMADNGVGFDPSKGDRLFGVFQRLHKDREYEGLGVGLAKVRRIVARHGGRTWAEGAVGQGATFYFSLPHPGTS